MAAKLRTAGAILLGKANLSQWANFRSSNSSNGWSAHGGQTIAAYHSSLRQDPSGSSSGSGVAASLGLAAATLGTETDGSILSPAGRNNIVGIKPTVGLTSRFLVIPISEHQDTVGPMARTVKDAAYVLQAIAGPDIRGDNYTSQVRLPLPNYVAACRDDALEGARIGVPRNVIPFFGNDSTTLEELVAFDRALADMQGAGATIVDPADFTQAEALAVSDAESDVLRADFISNLASYLSELTVNPTGVRSLADVRRFTQQAAGEMFPDRNTDTWDEALGKTVVDDVTGTATQIGGFNNTDPRFWAALQQNLNLGGEGGLLGALERNRLDAIVLPTTMAPHWAAIIGAPAISVPLGAYGDRQETVANRRGDLVDTGPGIPFGISFLGRRFDEARLIGLAHAFEQRSRVRETVLPKIAIDAEIRDFAGL